MKKVISLTLVLLMLLSALPMSALAAVDYDASTNKCDCYNVVSKTDYDIAPGISESEIVLNFDDGSRRQVLHIMEADMSNEYVTVLNSYYGMYPEEGDYQVAVMSEQAKWVEDNMGLNVVGGMNTTLSWYNTAFYTTNPQLINSPLGFTMLNGEVVFDACYGFPSVLVINKDFDEQGNPRPADIPKVEMVTIETEADLDGWEYQVIPCSSGFIVKDGKHALTENHLADNTNSAPRSVVGIKPDGTVVTMMNDGRQSPYSAGMSMYECAEVMISLGCSFAVNCDGGGSSTFLSQRPGEDLALHCIPSDGPERPTTSGILFISTAPATGEFARANITSDHVYYTPGSTVQFDVLGTDLVGNEAEIPADATWQIKEDNMGTIVDGVFVSNGTVGPATAQMVYGGEVVGECAIQIVVPETLEFTQNVMTVPFGKEVQIGLKATIHEGVHEVVLGANDIDFSLDNTALGVIDGFTFKAVAQANAPENVAGTLKATLKCNPALVATAAISLGKGSETLFDFENGIDGWLVGEVNGNEAGHEFEISAATDANGQVHDGNGSLRFYTDALSAKNVHAGGYAQVGLYLEQSVIIENARSLGFWIHIPEDFPHLFMRMFYWYDKDGNGTYESKNTITLVNQPTIYNIAEEDGWYYYSANVSAYKSIMITGLDQAPAAANKPVAQNYRFIEIASPHTNTNTLWQTYGSINGPRTIYIDSITVDYSEAVDDREAPVFGEVSLISGMEGSVALAKRNTVTTTNNKLSVNAAVAENTQKSNATGLNAASAKAYIDGALVDSTYANGKISISEISVADGVHRVKFEICDNAGNKSSVIRLINVQSGVDASTIQVVPKDATLDRLYGGSVYWMDIKATDIETIQSVKTVIDLNSVNHWELDNMVLAPGFTAQYTVDKDTNSATITITRTGLNSQTGEAVLASLPIRVVYYDTDMATEGYTAESYWQTFNFWPQDVKVDVDMGEITYVNGFASNLLNTFSNEEFSVDTEMYIDSQHMDVDYKAERGTCHVHTPEALVDKPATCTEDGYTGRTYCAVCDSVVDWGTTQKATGHNYENVNGQMVCACGDVLTQTGLYQDGDVYRYLLNGVPQGGWIMVGSDWHYFDTKTLAAVPGKLTLDGVTFEFEATGKLVSGVWAKTLYGTRYYYGPDLYGTGWAEIDGNRYYFQNTYRYEGYRMIFKAKTRRWYDFGTDGICKEDTIPDGFYWDGDKGLGYVVDGIGLDGLREIDGEYYYFDYYGYAQKGYVNVGTSYCDLPTGNYYFDEDYKAVNGIVDGVYYENGRAKMAGLVQIDGDYYFAGGAKGEIAINKTQYVWQGNGLLPEGTYTFGADGKMLNGVYNGVYYEQGKPTLAGLVQIDGDYYFAGGANGEIAVHKEQYVWKTNDLLPEGTYAFGADGKMLDGIVEKDGVLCYYETGKPKMAGLVKVDGDYYFAYGTKGEIITNRDNYYAWKSTCDLPMGSNYSFGADGKMLNGIVEVNGVLCYYVNGKAKMDGLVKVGNDYYFAYGTKGEIITDRDNYYAWKSTCDLPMDTNYSFGADGKMLNGIVNKNGTLYYYETGKPRLAGLVEIDGAYYFAGGAKGEITVNKAQYVWQSNGLLPEATYEFGADGKMLDGLVTKNGTLYYYETGKPRLAGLVQIDGAYYFVGGANGEVTVNKKQYVWQSNGLLPEATYEFDADGKMRNGIVEKDGKLYGYINGKAQYGLFEFEGNYYFAKSADGELVKDGTFFVWEGNGYTLAMNYHFDALGRVIL